GGGAAGVEQGEVAHLVLDAGGLLVPLVERLDVDRADLAMAALLQDADQMAADEATGTGDDHEIILGHSRAFQQFRGGPEVKAPQQKLWGTSTICVASLREHSIPLSQILGSRG